VATVAHWQVDPGHSSACTCPLRVLDKDFANLCTFGLAHFKSCILNLNHFLFFRITQYIRDTRNARTLIPTNTRTQTLPLGASSKTIPANPQD
jgi:hypothetical protein